MNLINCDELPVVLDRLYGGATGPKIAVKYRERVWLLKCRQNLIDKDFKNVEISKANDIISEYIGSHIYSVFGVPVHDTLLGTYKGKECVICSDDAYPCKLFEFKEFRNSLFLDNMKQPSSGMSTKLQDILDVIEASDRLDTEVTLERFWLMFVIDSLIGNTDRNNGNWAFLFKDGKFVPYEVYDCGGCLNNKRSDNQMQKDISTNKINNLALNYTFNYRNNNGKRINPFRFIEEQRNIYIDKALNLFDDKLLQNIFDIIDSLDNLISDTRKTWYKEILSIRFNKLLSLKRLSIDLNNIKLYMNQYNVSEEEFYRDLPRLIKATGSTSISDLNDKIRMLM